MPLNLLDLLRFILTVMRNRVWTPVERREFLKQLIFVETERRPFQAETDEERAEELYCRRLCAVFAILEALPPSLREAFPDLEALLLGDFSSDEEEELRAYYREHQKDR